MGDFFEAAMKRKKVNMQYCLRKKGGKLDGVFGAPENQRIMRPAFDENCRLLAKEIPEERLKGPW